MQHRNNCDYYSATISVTIDNRLSCCRVLVLLSMTTQIPVVNTWFRILPLHIGSFSLDCGLNYNWRLTHWLNELQLLDSWYNGLQQLNYYLPGRLSDQPRRCFWSTWTHKYKYINDASLLLYGMPWYGTHNQPACNINLWLHLATRATLSTACWLHSETIVIIIMNYDDRTQ